MTTQNDGTGTIRTGLRGGQAGGGFTLVELLLVVGIIAVLIAITLVIGRSVAGSGRERLTENALRIMGASVSTVMQSGGGVPSATVDYTNPGNSTQRVLQPIADARIGNTTEMINSVGWYMVQASRVSEGGQVFSGLDSKLVMNIDPTPSGSSPTWQMDQPSLPSVMDAWGRPMRYVHPAFDGLIHGPDFAGGSITFSGRAVPVDVADVLGPPPAGGPSAYGIGSIRRNNAALNAGDPLDSDGGVCPNQQPYFYSAGADGKVGQIRSPGGEVLEDYNKDNVYSVSPQIQEPG